MLHVTGGGSMKLHGLKKDHIQLTARSHHLRRLKLLKDNEFVALRYPFYNIGASAHPMAAFSGFNGSHDPPPSGDARGIVPLHHDVDQNGQQSGYMLHYCCVD